MEGLTRQEKEDYVLELYRQKKTYHEIAKEARVSLRDIGPILKRSGIEQSLSLSSQAYKLFSEGKSPNEVAIALNNREPEVTQLYQEYWRLNQLYNLNQIYEETKGNFSFLLELYSRTKAAGMTVAHIIRLLRVANKDLPSIEYRCQEFRREAASLETRSQNAARTLEQLNYVILDTQNTLDHYELQRKQQRAELDKIFHQKTQLEEFVECFKSNSTEYAEIKEKVKQEVENTLTNPKELVRLALLALIESLRKDTSKFQLLYYQMSTDITAIAPSQSLTSSFSSLGCPSLNVNEKPFQDNDNATETFQNFVLNEAENLYDKLLEDSINKVGIISNKLSSLGSCKTEPSDVQNSSSAKKIAAFTYRKEEEHTFFESEADTR
jgi:hypothetical protein